VASGMSVAAILLASSGLRRVPRAGLTYGLGIAVTVLAYFVLLPLLCLLLIWVSAGLGSF
jgi:hypothetical protein